MLWQFFWRNTAPHLEIPNPFWWTCRNVSSTFIHYNLTIILLSFDNFNNKHDFKKHLLNTVYTKHLHLLTYIPTRSFIQTCIRRFSFHLSIKCLLSFTLQLKDPFMKEFMEKFNLVKWWINSPNVAQWLRTCTQEVTLIGGQAQYICIWTVSS